MWGWSSRPPPLTSDLGSSSPPFLHRCSLALSAAAPDLGRGVTPLGRRPSGIGFSRLLPLTSDVGFGLLNLIWEPILCEACSFNMGQQTGPTYGRLKQRPVRDYLKNRSTYRRSSHSHHLFGTTNNLHISHLNRHFK